MKLVIVTALVVLGGAQAATGGGAHVAVRTSQYGKVLFTSAGKALYVFECRVVVLILGYRAAGARSSLSME